MGLRQAIINIRISPDFSGDKAASGLEVVVPMPREVARVHCELGRDAKAGAGGQSWDWQERARRLVWKFKRVPGGVEHTLRVRILASPEFFSRHHLCAALRCCKALTPRDLAM